MDYQDKSAPISLYVDKAPSCKMVKKWYSEFNRGRTSLSDEFREGLPKSVVINNKLYLPVYV